MYSESLDCSSSVYTERKAVIFPAQWPVTAGSQQDARMDALSPSACDFCSPVACVLLLPPPSFGVSLQVMPRRTGLVASSVQFLCRFCFCPRAGFSATVPAHVWGSLPWFPPTCGVLCHGASDTFVSVLIIRSTVFASPPTILPFLLEKCPTSTLRTSEL